MNPVSPGPQSAGFEASGEDDDCGDGFGDDFDDFEEGGNDDTGFDEFEEDFQEEEQAPALPPVAKPPSTVMPFVRLLLFRIPPIPRIR